MNIALLGATGSIGIQTLDVVRNCLPEAKVSVLTGSGFGAKKSRQLAELICEFKPDTVCVQSEFCIPNVLDDVEQISKMSNQPIPSYEIITGDEGLIACAAESHANIVVNALSGKVGLLPTLAAIGAGKNVALANKETLVTAGELVMSEAHKHNVRITPIDSEHSAIWQCLQGNDGNEVEKIILTASGGPFRTWSKEKIATVTAKEALQHPNWNMGSKITIDSATLMNKGLELIEALWLFGQPLNISPSQKLDNTTFSNIEVVVHPQSVIHSMVQYKDGSIMAQMGLPDMRLPILYALTSPKRISNSFPRLDFLTCGSLTFEPVDTEKFPCFALACHAAKVGGTLPAIMNYINEWAVEKFLVGELTFYDISSLIENAFGAYSVKQITTINDILEAENWAKEYVI